MQVIHQYFALIILIRVILIGRVRLSDSEMVLFHPSSASRFTSKEQVYPHKTISIHKCKCSVNVHKCKLSITGQGKMLIPLYCIMYYASSFQLEKGRATSSSRRAEESLSVASQDSQEMATSSPQPQPNDVNISTLNVIS